MNDQDEMLYVQILEENLTQKILNDKIKKQKQDIIVSVFS